MYSSLNSHNLCYASSKSPVEGFEYGRVLVSCGDIGLGDATDPRHAKNDTGNTHGSLIEIGGKYYIFYHRHTNRKQSSRQACAEEIRFEDGRFYQAEMTSCGLNGGPLEGRGHYSTCMACNVYGKAGTRFLSMIKRPKKGLPYITQDGGDRTSGPDQYVANMCDGSVAGFKYFDLRETTKLRVNVMGKADGILEVRTSEYGEPVARIHIRPSRGEVRSFSARLEGAGTSEKEALFFVYSGKGAFNFYSFDLK